MDKILIHGGVPLSGTIQIGGAKNAALPLMAASLLTADPLILANLPDLADIATMANMLVQHGVAIGIGTGDDAQRPARVFELSARHITSTTAPYDLVRKMRASFLVLGPLSRAAAAPACHCLAAATSVCGRSICTSRGCSASAPRSSCAKAISRRAPPKGCAAPRSRLPASRSAPPRT